MNSFNTYFISSTINTPLSRFSSDIRFTQTVATVGSIRRKDPSSRIVVVDNSLVPLTNQHANWFHDNVDLFNQYEHGVFSQFCNQTFHFTKGMGEILMMEKFLSLIKQHNLIGTRIFKISGRYLLADGFDIQFYNNSSFHQKYIHKQTSWWYADNPEGRNGITKMFFETVFWSFCGSLYNEYRELLYKIFKFMVEEKENIEVAHFNIIPPMKRLVADTLHIEGHRGEDGVLIYI